VASTQQRTVFSHFTHFLAGVALLRATPLVFVAEMHPNPRALRNLMAKASRARITLRRFERPLQSASMKHPIMRTLLDALPSSFLALNKKNSTSSQKKSWTFAEKSSTFSPFFPTFSGRLPTLFPKSPQTVELAISS
jgi:hypothetical protein